MDIVKGKELEATKLFKDYLLVEPEELKETTKTGLVLANADGSPKAERTIHADGTQRWSTVVCTGPECRFVKEGYRVLMTGRGATHKVDGKDYILLQEDQLHVYMEA